jgi:ABC-type lipoprotein export system ATPase subunit
MPERDNWRYSKHLFEQRQFSTLTHIERHIMNTIHTKVDLNIQTMKRSSTVCRNIIKTFGLSEEGWQESLSNLDIPTEGIILITGASGVGKSLLLKEISRNFSAIRKIPHDIDLEKPIAEIIPYDDAGGVIRYLSKFGLGEPRILISPFSHLSDGQKERFLIALALLRGEGPLLLDEFTTRLDRRTAHIIAINLGKMLRTNKQNAFIASCHDDIVNFLKPDTHIELCPNGNHRINIIKAKNTNILRDLKIVIKKSTIEDYKKLSRYHYENDNPNDIDMLKPLVDHVVAAYSNGEVIGVNLCIRPWPKAFEIFPEFLEINKYVLQSFRVIVHPQYRGIGLTKALDIIPGPNTKTLLSWSAFSSYYSFPILANYQRLNSPFEIMSHAETLLQAFVEPRQKNKGKPLHLFTECHQLWQELTSTDQKLLKTLIVNAASEKSLRLTLFQRKISGLDTSTKSINLIKNIFLKLYSKSSYNALPMLLAETVYRPMAMFGKHLDSKNLTEDSFIV